MLSIESAGATNSPLWVPVTLIVSPLGGGTSTAEGAAVAISDAAVAKDQGCHEYGENHANHYRSELQQTFSYLTLSVAAGRASYVKSQADACIAWIDGATCAEWNYYDGTMPAPCSTWVAGLVLNGDVCYQSAECSNGWCDLQTGGVCPGACSDFTAHGAGCSSPDECGPGYLCDSARTCVATTTPPIAGQTCASMYPRCAMGLYCDDYTTHKCLARIPAGGTCRSSSDCQDGLGCDAVGMTGTCKTLVGSGGSCVNGVCGEGLYCSSNSGSICKDQPLAGQDCSDPGSTYGNGQCVDGSYCLGATTRVCTVGTAAPGAPCVNTPDSSTPAASICKLPGYCMYDGVSSSCVGVSVGGALPPSACY
jgi:hypothetical protein